MKSLSLPQWGPFLSLKTFGRWILFCKNLFQESHLGFHPRIRKLTLHQAVLGFERTWSTVVFSGAFVGAIVVLHFNEMLHQFSATYLLGGLSSSALIREVAPLLISFLMAGKVGAFLSAELSSFQATGQVTAMECMNMNPRLELAAPRLIGTWIAGVLLFALGLLSSLVGALVLSMWALDHSPLQFFYTVQSLIGVETLLAACFRSIIYSFLVASVCCFVGYQESKQMKSVGLAVQKTASMTLFALVLANLSCSFVITQIERIHLIFAEVSPSETTLLLQTPPNSHPGDPQS